MVKHFVVMGIVRAQGTHYFNKSPYKDRNNALYVCVHVWVYVFGRERERARKRETERERGREGESDYLYVLHPFGLGGSSTLLSDSTSTRKHGLNGIT